MKLELDEDIKQALRGRHIPSEPLGELIDRATGSMDLFLLFKQLQEDEDLKRLLFLQPDDLFYTSDGVSVPLLYQGRVVSSDGTQLRSIESKTLDRVVAMEVDAAQQNQLALKETLGLREEEIEDTLQELGDVLGYAVLRILQDNPEFAALLDQEDDLTVSDVRAVIRGREEGLDLSSLEEIGSSLEESETSVDPEMERVLRRFAKESMLGAFSVLENSTLPSSPVPSFATAFHGSCGEAYTQLLDRAGLDPETYGTLLDDLYRSELITTRDVISWCERCNLKNTAYTKHHGDVAPADLRDDRCLSCNRRSSHTALFAIDPELRDLLFAKDGLLAVYVGWLLRQSEIPYSASDRQVEPEADFLVDGSVMIESKVLRANRDQRQAHDALDTAFGQLRKQIESREEEGLEIDRAAVVWNRWESPDPSDLPFSTRYRGLRQNYGLEVVGLDDIEAFVDDL